MKITLPSHLSDADLLAAVRCLARGEREATAQLIAHLAEMDARRLYLGEGFPSLYMYCTTVLRLSEDAAYHRIEVARAARRHPEILEKLAEGSLTLATVRLLSPHLTQENKDALIAAASGKTRYEVEEQMAGHAPRPDVPSSIRPLAPNRFEVRFTATAMTREKLRLAQDMLRHAVPDGDMGEVIDRALTLLIEDLARKRDATTDQPREGRGTQPGSRHIPAKVRRAVAFRDRGRCAFTSKTGQRCNARGFMQFHHIDPYGVGGKPTVANVSLRCQAHNNYEADLFYGFHRSYGFRRQPVRRDSQHAPGRVASSVTLGMPQTLNKSVTTALTSGGGAP